LTTYRTRFGCRFQIFEIGFGYPEINVFITFILILDLSKTFMPSFDGTTPRVKSHIYTNDCLLTERYVEPYQRGVSFLGIKLEEKIVAKVVVNHGNAALNGDAENNHRGRILFGNDEEDRDICGDG
jgi:hypothetical protein